MYPTKFLIDGVDRLGKSTLTQSLLDKLGYHLVVHYDKPKVLAAYSNQEDPRKIYQRECNIHMFNLLYTPVPMIFDRTHLGEMVYAPMYRKYSGDYVLEMEETVKHNMFFTFEENILLILLTTSNFDIVTDDGQSFDFSKKEVEQELFKDAFNKSKMTKVMVDVHNGQGGYKSKQEILDEVLNKYSSFLEKGSNNTVDQTKG